MLCVLGVCRQEAGDEVWVTPPDRGWGTRPTPLLFTLQGLMRQLPEVVVAGVPSVQRAVISQDSSRHGRPRCVGTRAFCSMA